MTAKRSRPGVVTGAADELVAGSTHQDTGDLPRESVAARLRGVDDLLEAVWTALVTGTLRLDQLHHMAPHAAAVYLAGFDAGIAAQAERVRQAEHDADRLYIRAFNEPQRAAEIQHRLDRQLASCPPNIEPHSPEYFEHVLRGAMIGGAA